MERKVTATRVDEVSELLATLVVEEGEELAEIAEDERLTVPIFFPSRMSYKIK